jgi:hypothetical protein
MSTPLASTDSARNALGKLRYTHDAMIDLILANPGIHQNHLAAEFGFSAAWVSRVICSDAFQKRLAERKDEVVDPLIVQNFEQRVQGLAAVSLEIVQEKLESTRNGEFALKTLELTTKALGFGARDRNATNIQNNFVVHLPEKAEDANSWAQTAKEGVARLAARSVAATDVVPKGA